MSLMLRHATLRHTALLAVAAFALGGCSSRKVDLAKVLQVTELTTGWYDAGVVEGGKNKLVPSVSFRLKNADTETLASVQLFARFSQLHDAQEWGTPPYVKAIGPEGLPPGQSTNMMILRSNLGYTGEQPRLEMLQHDKFIDARVELFAKYMANNWVKLTERQIARQLITR
jgi:hypothetical protein